MYALKNNLNVRIAEVSTFLEYIIENQVNKNNLSTPPASAGAYI